MVTSKDIELRSQCDCVRGQARDPPDKMSNGTTRHEFCVFNAGFHEGTVAVWVPYTTISPIMWLPQNQDGSGFLTTFFDLNHDHKELKTLLVELREHIAERLGELGHWSTLTDNPPLFRNSVRSMRRTC